ncbi:MAG TPA: hypothetical protein VIJ94_00340 [Caulobacteraceae bacterium]
MQQLDDESGDQPQVTLDKVGRSTHRSTGSGQAFTTHQRTDLRWIYRLDGVDSERTYPTAGDAERGALAALMAAAKRKTEAWKMAFLAAVVAVPILYGLFFLYRLVTG